MHHLQLGVQYTPNRVWSFRVGSLRFSWAFTDPVITLHLDAFAVAVAESIDNRIYGAACMM